MPEITINGMRATVPVGTTVASAVLSVNVHAFRRSCTGAPRGPLCGMGICYECRLTIDSRPQVISCQILCRDGMDIRTA